MSTNFPSSLDTTSQLPNARATGDVIPASDNNNKSDAIIAIETKLGTGVSVPTTSGHVLTVTGTGATAFQAPSAAGGDASTNTSSSVDSEVALFSGTGGKTLKRATGSGVAKLSSGVLSTATSGTDYAPATSGSAILKGNGSGGFSSAVSNTDYIPGVTPGTSGNVLTSDGSNWTSAAPAGGGGGAGGVTVIEDFTATSDLTTEHVISSLDLDTDGCWQLDIHYPYKSGWKASLAINSQSYTDIKFMGTRNDGSSAVQINTSLQYYVVGSDSDAGYTSIRLMKTPTFGAFGTFLTTTQNFHTETGGIYFSSQDTTGGATKGNVTQLRIGLSSGNMIPTGTRIRLTKV